MTGNRSYQVTVAGHVGQTVADSFAPLVIHSENGETTISGDRLDAAMLSGLMRTIERMGLELIAIRSHVNGAD